MLLLLNKYHFKNKKLLYCIIILACAKYFWEQNPEVKKTLLEPLQKEHLPVFMDYLEKLPKENGGYLACGRVSYKLN